MEWRSDSGGDPITCSSWAAVVAISRRRWASGPEGATRERALVVRWNPALAAAQDLSIRIELLDRLVEAQAATAAEGEVEPRE